MGFHLNCALAYGDLALRRYRYDRRQQWIAGLRVSDDLRTLTFHNRNQAIGGSEVYAEYTRHG
jgi:hypothetical protein